MSHGRFCKTVIQVTVLSEGPFDYENLYDVYQEITNGEASGEVKTVEACYLTGKQAAKELIAQGSDPSFLGLTPSGKRKEF
jgi:hypothetical protein